MLIYEVAMVLGAMGFQFRQIGPYWASGLVAGSLVSVYLSRRITEKMSGLSSGRLMVLPLVLASILGIISPLCMYGTVPIIAALGKKGIPQHLLAAFMVSSILLNPNIFFFSFALGLDLALTRLFLSFLSGVLAGGLVLLFFKNRPLFSFERFPEGAEKKKKAFVLDLFKAFRITAPYLLFGISLSALFDRYVPPEWVSALFGSRRGLGVLFATTLSIPLYVCGGGTIPLIRAWMHAGMGPGDAMAFMLAGPALKINNLSALKMIFRAKSFLFYLIYCMGFAILAGWAIEYILR